jgi:hypothetical protein
MHPIPPATRAEVRGESLGDFDDAGFMAVVAAAEAKIDASRLFTRESELEFEYRERYHDAAEMLDDIRDGWEGCVIPSELEQRILAAGEPVDIWERVVLRKFHAKPAE